MGIHAQSHGIDTRAAHVREVDGGSEEAVAAHRRAERGHHHRSLAVEHAEPNAHPHRHLVDSTRAEPAAPQQ